ncbi:MAG: hypothetical protein AB1656_12045 [Candidatus Omnitrophota bacterium]
MLRYGHAVTIFIFLFSRAVPACDKMTVRDAAFREERDMHRLCLIAKPDDPQAEAMAKRLDAWFGTAASDFNAKYLRVDIGDPKIQWRDYGLPSAPPSAPVAVLAGFHALERQAFFIDHWEPEPGDEDLDILTDSPARQRLRQELPRRIAVLLYIPSAEGENPAAARAIEETAAYWNRRETAGMVILRVSRADKRERLLLAFVGVKENGADWAALAFGRGKLMPPMQGGEIAKGRMDEQILVLLGDCTCLRSPSSLGVDIPMLWDAAIDDGVIALRADNLASAFASASGSWNAITSTIAALIAFFLIAAIAGGAILWRRIPA